MAATNLPVYESGIDKAHRRVIFASSLGTVFEWYDFYLYGSLAAIMGKQFFSGVNETTGFIFALLAFAAGFAVRPFGALVFGRLGDLVGRKYTFLITIVIMGLGTALIGVLPSYAQVGMTAPILLIALRLLQGLALGGEYGGAATYVAEHAPQGKRGLYTSWIQTTATLGLFLSLLVILFTRQLLGSAFDSWGWRIPFLASVVLLIVSVYIRMQLAESPVFLEMKSAGTRSKAPLTESFARWGNLRIVIFALLGATAGEGVVWYAGQFYALFFLTQILKVDAQPANLLIAAALLIATPFFVVFGRLSDRIGRKKIILIGCLLAAVTYVPIFKGITHYANPAIERAAANSPVTVIADPNACSFQFDPVGKTKFTKSCDVAKATARQGRSALLQSGSPRRRTRPGAHRLGRDPLLRGSQHVSGRVQGGQWRLHQAARRQAQGRRLPRQGGSRSGQLPDGAAAAGDPGAVRHHGVRADRRLARGAVPGAHPLHLHVLALSHRQRLVRRLPAPGRLCTRGTHRQHLLRLVVSDHRRAHDGGGRRLVPAGDQGPQDPVREQTS